MAASDSFRIPACNFIKKLTPDFADFLRTSFDRIHVDECFLFLSVNFEKFFWTPFYRVCLGNCLFYVQVAEFQPADTVKNI